jgi:hypothetical protein
MARSAGFNPHFRLQKFVFKYNVSIQLRGHILDPGDDFAVGLNLKMKEKDFSKYVSMKMPENMK